MDVWFCTCVREGKRLLTLWDKIHRIHALFYIHTHTHRENTCIYIYTIQDTTYARITRRHASVQRVRLTSRPCPPSNSLPLVCTYAHVPLRMQDPRAVCCQAWCLTGKELTVQRIKRLEGKLRCRSKRRGLANNRSCAARAMLRWRHRHDTLHSCGRLHAGGERCAVGLARSVLHPATRRVS